MGLFWNRKKKDETENKESKPGLFGRLFGRDASKEQEEIDQVPETTFVEKQIEEEPTKQVVPQTETPKTPEKSNFFSRLFNTPQTELTDKNTEEIPAKSETSAPPIFQKQEIQPTQNYAAQLVPITETPIEEESTAKRFFYRFKKAVSKTKQNIVGQLDTLFHGKKTIDADLLDHLEEILIGADIGVQTTIDLVEKIRQQVDRKQINNADELKRLLKSELLTILQAPPSQQRFGKNISSETDISEDIRPYVMIMVGVNGVGKTTTIAKLANLIKNEGNDVIICAADTFRAAASDQLAVWAERTNVELIQQKAGTDPAAVVFDALVAAKARNADVLIIDTAGRLHTKVNLMQELEKISRISKREVQDAPHEVLLVIDAVTGQNGLEQARQFTRTVNVTGIVLTKLDGTAKGGIVVAIAKELGIPIRYIGIGEQLDDLVVFSPEDYVKSLFE